MADQQDEARGVAPPFYALFFLPNGLTTGFVSITLGYVLSQHGVSVAAIAGIVGLRLLPETWKFLMGPVLDLSLSSRLWYLICVIAAAACLLSFALFPLTASSVPVLDVLALLAGVASTAASSSAVAAMALTTPNEKRGAIAGWGQTGNLGGVGVGGGLGLWITTHAGGLTVAALVAAAVCLLCATPMLLMRVPRRPPGVALKAQAAGVGQAVWALLRTRTGVLVMLAVTLPAGLGAAANLLPAAAGSWRASADLVAVVTGVLGGLASVPGCIIGGYLCDRFPRRTVFMGSAVICAIGEAAMAAAPHTPFFFAAFVLGNAVLTGVAWGAVAAVIYDCLGRTGAATVASVLSSLCNLPVAVVTVLIGWVQTRHGSSAMLLTEAGLGAASVAVYGLVLWFWRPQANPNTAHPGGGRDLAQVGAA